MFPLASRLDRSANADLNDSFRTKKALNNLGYLDVPSFGLTKYPNEQLFEGITKFQNDNGLKVDGIMKPGDETAKKLGETLTQSFGSLLDPVKAANDQARGRVKTSDTHRPSTLSGLDPARRVDGADGSARRVLGQTKKPSNKPSRPSRVDPLEATLESTLGNPQSEKAFWDQVEKHKAAKQQKARAGRHPFTLKSPVASNVNVDLEDSLRTKTALHRLGYLKAPEHGLTRYPNQLMFDAIEQFQKARGLKRDGIMKPGGPTERVLDKFLSDRGISIMPRDQSKEGPLGEQVGEQAGEQAGEHGSVFGVPIPGGATNDNGLTVDKVPPGAILSVGTDDGDKKPMPPIAGMDGKTPTPRQPRAEKGVLDQINKVAKGVLGPVHKPLTEGAAATLTTLSPGVDVQDMLDGSAETMEALNQGDFKGATAGMAKTAASIGAVALPGSISGAKQIADSVNLKDLTKLVSDKQARGEKVIVDLGGGKTSQIKGAINFDPLNKQKDGVSATVTNVKKHPIDKERTTPLPDSAIDVIYATGPRTPVYKDAARALKPGGQVVITGTYKNGNRKVPNEVELAEIGLRVVQRDGAPPPELKDYIFRGADGRRMKKHQKQLTTILEKVR